MWVLGAYGRNRSGHGHVSKEHTNPEQSPNTINPKKDKHVQTKGFAAGIPA